MLKKKKSFLSIDGIRFETKEGWWLLRASNTEEYVICRVEGKTYENFCTLASELILALEEIGLKMSAGLEKSMLEHTDLNLH